MLLLKTIAPYKLCLWIEDIHDKTVKNQRFTWFAGVINFCSKIALWLRTYLCRANVAGLVAKERKINACRVNGRKFLAKDAIFALNFTKTVAHVVFGKMERYSATSCLTDDNALILGLLKI